MKCGDKLQTLLEILLNHLFKVLFLNFHMAQGALCNMAIEGLYKLYHSLE